MFPIPEQFSAATKSQFETQLKIMNAFASKAFDSAEQVIALNISVTKATIEKSSAAAQQLLAAKDPRELFSLGAQPNLDSVLAYGRQLLSIATTTQTDLIASAKSKNEQTAPAQKTLSIESAQPVVTKPVAAAPAPVAKPVVAAAPAPVAKPVAAAPAPVAKPVVAAAPTPVAKPVAAAAPAPVAKPVVAAAPAPVAKPVAAAAPAPVAKSVVAAAPAPVAKPVAAAAPAPVAKPVVAAAPVAKPVVATAPVAKPAAAPAVKAKAKPAPAAAPKQLDMLTPKAGTKK